MAAGLIAGLLIAAPALAASHDNGPTEEQRADWARRMDYAKAQQKEAGDKKDRAKEILEAKQKACFKKFRVNDCQQEAKQEYIKAAAEARRQENEGKALERQIKKEQLADKDARRIEEAPQKEADLKERKAETQVERQEAEAERASKVEKKAQKEAEGEAKARANEERLRQKREQHERRVAEKLQKAQGRDAQTTQ